MTTEKDRLQGEIEHNSAIYTSLISAYKEANIKLTFYREEQKHNYYAYSELRRGGYLIPRVLKTLVNMETKPSVYAYVYIMYV